MRIVTWIILLVPLSGVVSDNSASCSTPNLFNEFKDKFGQKDSDLKQYGTKYFKCLAMYGNHYSEKHFALTNDTMNSITQMKPGIDDLVYELYSKLTKGNPPNHPDYFPAFKKTCFYKSHLKNFGEELDRFLCNKHEPCTEYELKLTCPLGLLMDIICTFTSCLQSDCRVDGEKCASQENDVQSCRSSIDLKFYCKKNFASFVESCVDDKELIKSLNDDKLQDNNCSDFNYLYQGLTSLQVVEAVEGSVIALNCHESGDGYVNVTMTCFKDGKSLKRATWMLDNVKQLDDGTGTLNISLEELSGHVNVSCYEGSVELAQIPIDKIYHQLCNPDKEESNDVNNIRSSKHNSVKDRTPTDVPATTEDPGPTAREKWMEFYTERDEIWFTNGANGGLDGIDDAMDNKVSLQANVDKLSVATVSVMGRLTPICGEMWNERAAKVFCRDAGAQLQQNWTATFVGSLHKSRDERPQEGYFYKHYLRNITCKGTESNIIWCDHDGWYHHSGCTHDAVVICSEVKIGSEVKIDYSDVITIVCLALLGAILITVAIFGIMKKWFPNYIQFLPIKDLIEICRPSTKASSIVITIMDGAPPLKEPQDQGSSEISTGPESGSLSEFDWGDSSIELGTIPEGRQPVNINYPSPIPENVSMKRLNHPESKEWVSLYQKEGKTLVCKTFEDQRQTVDDMKTERFFLLHVNHPNIVKCVGEQELLTLDRPRWCFFMEHLEFGGLDGYLRSKDQDGVNHGHLMTVEDATNAIIGICRGLHYVHSLGYVHGDISTDNVFAYRNVETGLLDVKLGDFECFYRPDGGGDWKHGKCTFLYCAPEIILENPKDKKGDEIKKDAFKNEVWGLALVMWEIQSWIMCKKNKKRCSESGEKSNHTAPAKSSILESMTSIFMRSKIKATDDYDCRRHVHVALFEKINLVNPTVVENKPSKILMDKFYKGIHPHNIGLPTMDPKLDGQFGWPIKGLLKNCLAIDPTTRFSMRRVLEYLLSSAKSSPMSPLYKYKEDLESDLNRLNSPIRLEDVDANDIYYEIDPGEVFPPAPTNLQTNLGQLGAPS